MSSEKSKEKKNETECCSPGDFRNMSGMMSRCCTGKGRFDRSFMMKAMKGQTCCSPEPDKTTDDVED